MIPQQVAVFSDSLSGDVLEVYVTSSLEETKKMVMDAYTNDGQCDLTFSHVYEEMVKPGFEIFVPAEYVEAD